MKITKKIRYVFDFVFYRYCRLYVDLASPRGTPYEDGCVNYFVTLSIYVGGLICLIENAMSLDFELIAYTGLALLSVGIITGIIFPYLHKDYYKYLHDKFYDDYGEEDLAIPIILTIAPFVFLFLYCKITK